MEDDGEGDDEAEEGDVGAGEEDADAYDEEVVDRDYVNEDLRGSTGTGDAGGSEARDRGVGRDGGKGIDTTGEKTKVEGEAEGSGVGGSGGVIMQCDDGGEKQVGAEKAGEGGKQERGMRQDEDFVQDDTEEAGTVPGIVPENLPGTVPESFPGDDPPTGKRPRISAVGVEDGLRSGAERGIGAEVVNTLGDGAMLKPMEIAGPTLASPTLAGVPVTSLHPTTPADSAAAVLEGLGVGQQRGNPDEAGQILRDIQEAVGAAELQKYR